MKVLITGATGFVGSHLIEFLLDKNVEIYGTRRWRSSLENISHLLDKIKLVDCELTDLISVKRAIEKVKPDIIFHLAAQSFVPAGFSQPRDTIEVNVIGTLNLLEAVRHSKIDPIIHVCSTADIYGHAIKEGEIVDENRAPRPANLYSVSKLGEDMLGLQYHISYKLKTIRSRMLTHTGPRRHPSFVESSFAKQVAEIEAGLRKPVIHVGNLESVRTFLDVRDAVRAYWLLVKKCKYGEVYNICGNATVKIKSILDTLISYSDVKDKIEVKVDKDLLRPSDTTLPKLDISKFVKATEWKPEIAFEKTLKDILDYWREKIKHGK
ncbi:GDP-mannose 4,6-dehydratase [Candidatus Woesearchaeota archaeon]|nr:GDP-mannose 4,6-dehydratase [Candidatus Woesearchaeota archaeon]